MIELRPEVQAFAELMEQKLRAHDDRPGWKHESVAYLWRRLGEEADEMHEAWLSNMPACDIADEAADVANLAMMIADVVGGL